MRSQPKLVTRMKALQVEWPLEPVVQNVISGPFRSCDLRKSGRLVNAARKDMILHGQCLQLFRLSALGTSECKETRSNVSRGLSTAKLTLRARPYLVDRKPYLEPYLL